MEGNLDPAESFKCDIAERDLSKELSVTFERSWSTPKPSPFHHTCNKEDMEVPAIIATNFVRRQ